MKFKVHMGVNGSNVWRLVWSLCAAMAALAQASAQGLDTVPSARQPSAAVVPLCALLSVQEQELSTDQKYQKALCQLQALETPSQRDRALDTLRDLAAQGHSAAQRLIQLDSAPVDQPKGAPDPFGDGDDPAARSPGYHCHVFLRKKICHGGMDY